MKIRLLLFSAFAFTFLEAVSVATAATIPPKVVFIGDGTTYGWTFPANSNWINKGLPGIGFFGETVETLYTRFQSDVISLHPAIVHIMIGANDELQDDDANRPGVSTEFAAGLDKLVKEAEAANIKVVLGTDVSGYNLNAVLEGYGSVHNIPVINYADALCGCVASTGGNTAGIGFTYLPGVESGISLLAPGTATSPGASLGELVPTTAGYNLMTQLAQVAVANATNVTLKDGWLQDVSLPYEGNSPVANVNTVSGDQVIQFTPIGVFSDGSRHPVLNTTFGGSSGTWTSSNPLVMSVNQSGLALAQAAGTATIRYTPPNGVKFSSWVMYVSDEFVH